MEYISIQQAAEKWNMSIRRVQDLCKDGKVAGAFRFGRAWMIPRNAERPADGRTKEVKEKTAGGKAGLPSLPMPRKNPFLIFTDLYHTPGTAEEAVASLADQPEASKILQTQFDYQHGRIDKIYKEVWYFLEAHSGFNAVVSSGVMLSMCAMWQGDINLWRQARRHIYEAPCETEDERQALAFWLAVVDSAINDITEFPEWFKVGIFDCLAADSYCAARVFYVKYLYIAAHDLACDKITLKDVEGLGLMRTLPHIIEPMISQAKIERTIVPEAYLHLMAATVYHNLGDNDKAIPHIDRAIEIALPDKLYSLLVEHRTNLDNLLDDRLAAADENALKAVRALHKQMIEGWVKLHNILLERNISNRLTVREREAARLAAFGLTNSQIAERLNVTLVSVKQLIRQAMDKTGAQSRHELGEYV